MDSAIPDYIRDSVRSLPPLPAAVKRLLALAKEIDADFRQIASVIETDQTLTARTLRAANSAIYGMPRRIQTVRQATVLLGRETILSLAVGASVLSLQNNMNRRWPMDPTAFWRHSIAVATTANFLAKQLRLPDPEEAYVAGLLHDIGKLIMLEHFGDLYAQVLLAAQYGTKPLHILEQEIFETDHSVVGHALCLHWNLPQPLMRAVAEHHDQTAPAPNSIADIVRNANDLVKMMQLGNSANRYAELRTSQFLPHNQVRPSALRALILGLPSEIHSAEEVFSSEVEKVELGEDETAAGGPVNAAVPAPADLSTERPFVHLLISSAEEREMLTFMLWGMGYEPVSLNDTARDAAEEEPALLAGLITNLELNPARQIAYRDAGVPILDFAAWRAKKRQPTDGGHFNVAQLQTWLRQHLQPADAAGDEAQDLTLSVGAEQD